MFIKIFKLFSLKQVLTRWLALLCFTVASASNANQEQSNIASNTSPVAKDAFEWQFMGDLSIVGTQEVLAGVKQTEPSDYLQIGLLLDISYKGFFLQTNSRRSAAINGGEFGYQLTVQENWQLDLILKAYIEGFEPAEIISHQKEDIPHLADLDEREATGGIALRYSHFFDNALFYVDIAAARTGLSAHDEYSKGVIIDSFYSYLVPYRNWDIYFGAGLTYYDQAIVDYYIGIDADEVKENRALFKADSAFRAQLEVYAQYPLSQNWTFNAGLTQNLYSNHIKRSPLVDKNKLTQIMIGVLYVF